MIQVLLVEDDPSVRSGLRASLDAPASGVTVVAEAASISEARAIIPRLGDLDVAVVDLGLPDGSGVELIADIRRQRTGCEILVITVIDDPHTVMSALEAGARGYVLKSDPPRRILDAVVALATGDGAMSSRVARLVADSLAGRTSRTERAALSRRESELIEHLARGCTYRQAAEAMGITHGTVQTYVKRVYDKLDVGSAAEAVAAVTRRWS